MKGIDYSAEIPFHHKAPLGFYSQDAEQSIVKKEELLNVGVDQLEGKERHQVLDEQKRFGCALDPHPKDVSRVQTLDRPWCR
jgi:hypothetical protein